MQSWEQYSAFYINVVNPWASEAQIENLRQHYMKQRRQYVQDQVLTFWREYNTAKADFIYFIERTPTFADIDEIDMEYFPVDASFVTAPEAKWQLMRTLPLYTIDDDDNVQRVLYLDQWDDMVDTLFGYVEAPGYFKQAENTRENVVRYRDN